ncbi:hypothetical protein [Frankia sp. Cppng1_Ct_nod]|uniref:hypothetical protein n=1 Tax=Frankia sp. Cppng1_Ct_nod TaxID=2897162 RepID=UPI0020249F21|nr:hypothetical protein [Frankia sp. Cppng1_Ct_nod]
MATVDREVAVTSLLVDLRVAVSISDSPDLAGRGMGMPHQQHAFVELARHVLAAGGSLAYGGDLRPGGYTRALFDLVDTYDLPGRPGPQRVTDYLAWHLFLRFGVDEQAEVVDVATVVGVAPPPDISLDDPDLRGEVTTVTARWKRTRCLTAMRERMAAETGVRVMLGGGVIVGSGLYPGLLEEAVLTLRAGRPLFLLGGFGGCTERVISAVLGGHPHDLDLESQIAARPQYADLVAEAARAGTPADYEGLLGELRAAGPDSLANGLDRAENEALFTTDDVDEMVALVLRGLRRIAGRGSA